jgi:NADPH-dependent ferric siderophore reductase
MLRILFEGEDLADFVSLAPDDHIKLFLAMENGEIERRDYTPRRYDPAARTLAIDFALHNGGPATTWALNAKPGDHLTIGGPRGSAVVSPAVKSWLLIGDETAIPAIGRRLEQLNMDSKATSVILVAGPEEELRFDTAATLTPIWVHRSLSNAADPAALIAALEKIEWPKDTFVWIAAEATVARRARTYAVETRGHPLEWMKAAGYWRQGHADTHENFGD